MIFNRQIRQLITACMVAVCFQPVNSYAVKKQLIWSEDGQHELRESDDGVDQVTTVGDSVFDCFNWNGVNSGTVERWLLAILNGNNDRLRDTMGIYINGVRILEPSVDALVEALVAEESVRIVSLQGEYDLQINTGNPGQNTLEDILTELLREVRNGERVIVDGRSVEETTASNIVGALSGDGMRRIPDTLFTTGYWRKRQSYDIPYYDARPSSARLSQFCHVTSEQEQQPDWLRSSNPGTSSEGTASWQTGQVDIKADVMGSYVFISAGGNDVMLDHQWPTDVIPKIKAIGQLYRNLGAKKVIYVIPYTMGGKKNAGYAYMFASLIINAFRAYAKWRYLSSLAPEYFDAVIDLSDFNDRHRRAGAGGIPEPTPLGALTIAWRIARTYRGLSQTDLANAHPPSQAHNDIPNPQGSPEDDNRGNGAGGNRWLPGFFSGQ